MRDKEKYHPATELADWSVATLENQQCNASVVHALHTKQLPACLLMSAPRSMESSRCTPGT